MANPGLWDASCLLVSWSKRSELLRSAGPSMPGSPIRGGAARRPGRGQETAAVIVLLAGMQRSGSTFAFNVARDVLRARGRVYQEAPAEADVVGALARAGDAEHVLVKAHEADPLTISMVWHGAVRVVCTMRRIEDAAASWMEAFGWSEAETVEYLRAWLTLYARLRGAALLVPYAQLDRRPWLAAWRIAHFLCPDATPAEGAAHRAPPREDAGQGAGGRAGEQRCRRRKPWLQLLRPRHVLPPTPRLVAALSPRRGAVASGPARAHPHGTCTGHRGRGFVVGAAARVQPGSVRQAGKVGLPTARRPDARLDLNRCDTATC